MKSILIVTVLICLTLAEVQIHFYNTGGCSPRVPSEYRVRFEPESCYRIREVSSDCSSYWTCLSRGLEWNDFESCWAQNGTLSIRPGSFQVLDDKIRRDFTTNDCSGDSVSTALADSCAAESCGVVQKLVFPVTVEEDSEDSLDGGQIAGITLGSLAILVVLVCGCGILFSCLCCSGVILVAILAAVILFIYAILNTEDINSSGQTTLKGRSLTFMNKCWQDFCNKIAGENLS